MTIIFKKQHINNKPGDIDEVDEARGKYLIAVGVAELQEPEKKEAGPIPKNKAAGPGKKGK